MKSCHFASLELNTSRLSWKLWKTTRKTVKIVELNFAPSFPCSAMISKCCCMGVCCEDGGEEGK